jgi:addiction module HigA family antidote
MGNGEGPSTPGEVLREKILSHRGITQDQLAKAMRVSRYSINQLVNDRRTITAEMALRLAEATSTDPRFWLNLQQSADLAKARQRLRKELPLIERVRDPVPEADLFYPLPEEDLTE